MTSQIDSLFKIHQFFSFPLGWNPNSYVSYLQDWVSGPCLPLQFYFTLISASTLMLQISEKTSCTSRVFHISMPFKILSLHLFFIIYLLNYCYIKNKFPWDFLGGPVLWEHTRLSFPNAGGLGLIPGQGTRPHMPQLEILEIPRATTKRFCMQQWWSHVLQLRSGAARKKSKFPLWSLSNSQDTEVLLLLYSLHNCIHFL